MSANERLMEFGNTLQEEANIKIDKAIALYNKADPDLQNLARRMTGFSGEPTPEAIREHFDTLELLDEIDGLIDNLESNLALGD